MCIFTELGTVQLPVLSLLLVLVISVSLPHRDVAGGEKEMSSNMFVLLLFWFFFFKQKLSMAMSPEKRKTIACHSLLQNLQYPLPFSQSIRKKMTVTIHLMLSIILKLLIAIEPLNFFSCFFIYFFKRYIFTKSGRNTLTREAAGDGGGCVRR